MKKTTAVELIQRYCAGERDFKNLDLSDANLGGAELRGANLGDANLSYADLHDADLRDANLSGANLRGADLARARLNRSNLSGACLDYSCLPLWCGGANFTCSVSLIYQILAHVMTLDCDHPDAKRIKCAIKDYALKSHRAKDLGLI